MDICFSNATAVFQTVNLTEVFMNASQYAQNTDLATTLSLWMTYGAIMAIMIPCMYVKRKYQD